MRCERIEHLLYLREDELSSGEKKMLSDHLKTCSSCRTLAEKIQKTADLISELSGIPVKTEKQSIILKIMTRIQGEENKTALRNRMMKKQGDAFLRVVRWSFTAAAALFAALLVIQVFLWNGPEGDAVGFTTEELTSRENLIHILHKTTPIAEQDVEYWVQSLLAKNTVSAPLEKVIFEKYKQHILNNASSEFNQ